MRKINTRVCALVFVLSLTSVYYNIIICIIIFFLSNIFTQPQICYFIYNIYSLHLTCIDNIKKLCFLSTIFPLFLALCAH